MATVDENKLFKPIIDLNNSVQFGRSLFRGRLQNPDLKTDVTGIEGVGEYQALLLDSTVQSAFNKIVQDILSADWSISPVEDTPEDKECAQFISENLERVNLQHASRSLLQAYISGQQVVEPIWKLENKKSVLVDLISRDPRRLIWIIDEKTNHYEPRILTVNDLSLGIPIPPRKLIIYRYWLLYSDNPYGWGLGSIIKPLVCAKNQLLKAQERYSRRHSSPLGIANVPLNMPPEDAQKILSHLLNVGEKNGIVVPQGVDIQFIQSQGDTDSIRYLIDYYTREINLLISTEVEVGQPTSNRASSQVANELRLIKSKELADELDTVLNNTLIKWLAELNYPNVKPPRLIRQFNKVVDNYKPAVYDLVTIRDNFELVPTRNYLEKTYGIEFSDEPIKDEFLERFKQVNSIDGE
ncbi:MAG: phage portal protein family protein [Waterburya sp.]